MISIPILFCFISLLLIWLKWNYCYWKRNKVPGPKPTYLIGNIGSTLNWSEHFGILTAEWYKNYPNEPYIGFYEMMERVILVRDPDLIQDMLVTNFNSFRNNRANISKKIDTLTARNPFICEDNEWKEGRKAILPMFSQSKLKSVLPVMNKVGADFVEFIKSHPPNTDFFAKELSIRFTTENVVKSGFSIEPGCFENDGQNEFLKAGKDLFTPTFLASLKFLAIPFLPKWAFSLIPIPFIPAEMTKWFRKLVRTNKNSRSSGVQSNDLFQTLLQAQEKHNFDETVLAGYCLAVYFDGTETSGTALSYTLYELARNPQCQVALHEEIVRTIAKHDGKITYEAIQEMTYLNGVVCEATRIHPPVLWSRKVCTKPYTLPKTTEQSEPITIMPGTTVTIPIYAIHIDPKFYPNPHIFRPERFSADEQKDRPKCTFLTFGDGPRVCLGTRFAMIQTKVAILHIALNFLIKISQQHKPIVIDPKSILSYPKDGILLQFESR